MGYWGATGRGLCSARAAADLGATAALWLLVAGRLHVQEIVAAVLVGLGVAIVGVRVRAEVDHRGASVTGYVSTLAKQYLGAHRDCWSLTWALLRRPWGRPPAGRLRAASFVFGDAGPDATGRRVIATLSTSLRPNSFVVGFDREQGLILVHQLVDDGAPLVPAALVEARVPDEDVVESR